MAHRKRLVGIGALIALIVFVLSMAGHAHMDVQWIFDSELDVQWILKPEFLDSSGVIEAGALQDVYVIGGAFSVSGWAGLFPLPPKTYRIEVEVIPENLSWQRVTMNAENTAVKHPADRAAGFDVFISRVGGLNSGISPGMASMNVIGTGVKPGIFGVVLFLVLVDSERPLWELCESLTCIPGLEQAMVFRTSGNTGSRRFDQLPAGTYGVTVKITVSGPLL